jgi:hypothetical protein
VSNLGAFPGQPSGRPLDVGGAAGENGLQMALFLSDISSDPHAVAAHQCRQRAFDATAVFMVVFLESCGFLSFTGCPDLFVISADADRSSAFSCATARS